MRKVRVSGEKLGIDVRKLRVNVRKVGISGEKLGIKWRKTWD